MAAMLVGCRVPTPLFTVKWFCLHFHQPLLCTKQHLALATSTIGVFCGFLDAAVQMGRLALPAGRTTHSPSAGEGCIRMHLRSSGRRAHEPSRFRLRATDSICILKDHLVYRVWAPSTARALCGVPQRGPVVGLLIGSQPGGSICPAKRGNPSGMLTVLTY